MFSSRTHDRIPQLAVMLAIAIASVLLLARVAHAAVDSGEAQAGPSWLASVPWEAWIVAGLAALAGVETALKGLSMVLHAIAPRTKTPLDDAMAVKVDALHDKIDDVRQDLTEIAGAIIPRLPKPPGSGAATALMAVLVAGSLGSALAGTGCATAGLGAAAGIVAALDCEAAHLDAQALADARLFADAKVTQWLAGAGAPDAAKIKADLAPIKSDLGRCAIAGAIAAATAMLQPNPSASISALMGPGVPPAVVRAQFQIAARETGWPPVRVADGTVL